MQEAEGLGYYSSKDVNEVLKELSSGEKGLSSGEAQARLKRNGPNVLVAKKRYNVFIQFISHFKSPLILILLAAAIISFFTQQLTQGIIIVCIIFLGATLDFIQEYSANKALIKLIETVKTKATVIRNGKKEEIQLKNLVVGDIIFLSSGDMVPADARIIESDDFFVNQASITGESFPAQKVSEVVTTSGKQATSLENIIFSGTNVIGGSATAIIVKVGKDTEFGKIAAKVSAAPQKSDFEKGIGNFGFFLMKITIVLVLFIFLVNSLIKHDVFESFMFAIAIAVGITPDLLPMIMSVTMAVGSRKMSKKGVIVKKLSSIPNFGSMNILCTDKTGTITENKITLVKYLDFRGKENENVLQLAYLNSSFQTGIKNPLDEAILNFKKINIKGFKKMGEIPYDFLRKRMSVVVKNSKQNMIITKGAPEEVFECCKYYNRGNRESTFEKRTKQAVEKIYKDLSNQGFRVLAVASRKVDSKKSFGKDEEKSMTFEGLVSFFDPPKKDVKKTLKEIEELGIEIKIITGDDELVTMKVSKEVELGVKGFMLGSDIEKMSDIALKNKVQNTTIFARCSPSQKIRIINALHANNNVVGYLGDGINDAPALKASDVSISVNNAVDVAKESADIILTRKSLSDLKEGVLDGRKTFGNTMKYIMMSLSSNFGNMFSASGAVLFLPYLPMLPVQILLNNLIYDASQVTIPSDNVDKDWISRPKKWDIKFLKKFMYVFGPLSSVFDFATFIVFYFVLKVSAPVFQTTWFLESLATQTLVIHVIRTKSTPIIKSRASKLLVLTSLLGVAVGFGITYTPVGKFFGFTPLPWHFILIILGIVIVYLFLVEIAKRIFYKKVSF